MLYYDTFSPLQGDACKLFLSKREQINLGDVWFQQDGATAHAARGSMRLLRDISLSVTFSFLERRSSVASALA